MEMHEIFAKQKSRGVVLRSGTIRDRLKKLKALKKWILANRARIQEAVHQDLRKSPEEADISEIYVVTSALTKVIKNLKYWSEPETDVFDLTYLGTKGEVYYEPKGTVLIISPWNYPFNLAVGPLVYAIAAGNTVIMKPSELSEHTSELIRQMCEEVFVAEEVTVFTGGIDVSTELLKLPFDHIFFTGSPRVGKIVMEAASKHLASVTLELGGKSPCVVDESANIKDAAQKIAWGKWLNAGQTCLAPDYLFVHERIKDQFLEELKAEVIRQYGEKDYSCIISEGHFDRLNAWKEEALAKGAKLYYEGQSDPADRRLAPAIVEDVSEGTHLHENEIFGPICMVKSFTSLDHVIEIVNARPKALSAYLFTSNKKAITTFKQRTSSGALLINDTLIHYAHPHLPFGGVNNSGIGKTHGKYGLMEFSHPKTVLKQRVGWTLAKLFHPPYTKFKKLNVDLLIKYF
jgi:aldehyde dehydrogenase (NAD+)